MNHARAVISKAIARSELFIHFGLTAIVKNVKEELFQIYLPSWESGFKNVDIQNHQLNQGDSKKIEKALNNVKSAGIPDYVMGLDGKMYSIRIGGGYNAVEYVWWSDSAGDQWNSVYELRDIIDDLVREYRK